MQQVYYVNLDPERALGAEDLIPSFHILYSEPSQLHDPIQTHGVDIVQFERIDKESVYSTAKLLANKDLQSYIKRTSLPNPNILVFKSDKQIEDACKELGYNLLNPNYLVAKKYEDKLNFSRFLEESSIFLQPQTVIYNSLSEVKYHETIEKFGREFVIQFNTGHSGNTTFFVKNKIDLENLKLKYPQRMCKVVQKINGTAYTVNACITRVGTVIGGISEQLTGIDILTSSDGGTVGNDFSQRHLNDSLRSELINKTTEFAEILMKEGHKGIFGIDLILEEETNKFYVIEANIRQVLSASYFSYLQRMNRQLPIMLWHILELSNHNYYGKFESIYEEETTWINEEIKKFTTSTDKLEYNLKANAPINASQVFFRNTNTYPIRIEEQFPSGIYRIRGRAPEDASQLEDHEDYPSVYKMREDGWSTLCLKGVGYNILEAKAANGFFINSMPHGSVIPPLGEVGRLQFLESAYSSNESKHINGWILDVVNTIYENMRNTKVDDEEES